MLIGRLRLPSFFGALIVLGLLSSASVQAAKRPKPTTWRELKKSLPKSSGAKRSALKRFATNYRPAIKHRLRATREWRKESDTKLGQRLKAELYEASLFAVRSEVKKRKRALARALATATELKSKKATSIEDAIAADEALGKVLWALKHTRGKPGPKTEEAMETLSTKGTRAYKRLGDNVQAARAAFALIEMQVRVDDDRNKAITKLERFLRASSKDRKYRHRDLYPVWARAHRRLAMLLDKEGDQDGAAVNHFRSDRYLALTPNLSLFEPPELSPYLKTKRTMGFCRRAKRNGVDCAKVEEKRLQTRSYFDFTRYHPKGPFDPEVAQEVLEEYQVLLLDCLKAGAKRGETRDSRIEVEWAIGHDGRVKAYDLFPKRLRKSEYDKCLRESFDTFRYPRYQGEQQHMRLNWSVGE